MITLSRFYKWLVLPEFFKILKFLGQKEQIILQCVRVCSQPHLWAVPKMWMGDRCRAREHSEGSWEGTWARRGAGCIWSLLKRSELELQRLEEVGHGMAPLR